MLNPSNNRLDYEDILQAPYNYELDFAIATTYSLDLDSLIGASISLGLNEDVDSDLSNNYLFLLRSLELTANKIALFCETGQIRLPKIQNQLYIILEQMIFQITTSKFTETNKFSSFHPKMWLLRYIDKEGNPIYRVVVMSRNLTFDRSWDISFTMEGEKVEGLSKKELNENKAKNKPLADFIEYLTNYCLNEDKLNKMQEIINELDEICFVLNSKEFYDFDFIPNGIKSEYNITNYQLFDDFNELLIMSPFLANGVIKRFNDKANKSKAMLYTRDTSLNSLKLEDADNFDIFILKDNFIDGESNKSEEDIHAKLYMVKKGSDVDLYLGSLNASHNALYNNIEFMIRLRSKNRYLNIDKLSNSLSNDDPGGPEDPFLRVNLEDYANKPIEDSGKDLEYIIKKIIRSNPKALVTKEENKDSDTYKIDLTFDIKEDYDYEITVNPLLFDKKENLNSKITFNGLRKLQLSEFFIVTVTKEENEEKIHINRVLKVPTEGMPEDRESEVINSIISDEDAFMRYIVFLLGDDYLDALFNGFDIKGEGENKSSIKSIINYFSLYEKMLKTAYYHPSKFKEIELLISNISHEGVVPEGFEELYNTFKEAIGEDFKGGI